MDLKVLIFVLVLHSQVLLLVLVSSVLGNITALSYSSSHHIDCPRHSSLVGVGIGMSIVYTAGDVKP